jgi:hypothetical protein
MVQLWIDAAHITTLKYESFLQSDYFNGGNIVMRKKETFAEVHLG